MNNQNPLFLLTSGILLFTSSVQANPFAHYPPPQKAMVYSASPHYSFSQMTHQATAYQPSYHQQPVMQPVSHQRHTPYYTPEREIVIQRAKSVLGIRYRYGGESRREGFDCSGLIIYAHRTLGVKIPRNSAAQAKASRTIRRNQLRPGDLIFFNTTGRGVSHVGIYLKNGQFIHAASGGKKVTIDDLRKSYWQKRLVKYGTFLR